MMKVIICVDDDGGLAFNNRRQSRDSELIKKICEITEGERLWISQYSEPLFMDFCKDELQICENILEETGEDDYCFAECTDIGEYEEQISRLILFKWNRRYPSDMKLGTDISKYNMISCEEFAGSSHEKITMEIYEK